MYEIKIEILVSYNNFIKMKVRARIRGKRLVPIPGKYLRNYKYLDKERIPLNHYKHYKDCDIKRILYYRLFLELSFEDIGKYLGRRENAVKQKYYKIYNENTQNRTRARLTRIIRDYFDE